MQDVNSWFIWLNDETSVIMAQDWISILDMEIHVQKMFSFLHREHVLFQW